ncbi:MAG: hypothetical protein ABIG84_01520 [archaeon]
MTDNLNKPEKKEDNPASVASVAVDSETLENNKKAYGLCKSTRRFMNLNELDLALENIQEAISLDTVDDDRYNIADAYFLATQICRRLKDYQSALKYIEEGIKTVNPYRPDSPKFVLAKGVIYLQSREYEKKEKKIKKELASAIEGFRMAITVSEMLLNQKTEYRFEAKDISVIKKYHTIAIFDLAYANDLMGYRRESIAALDRLFELYPDFSIHETSFELYHKIRDEKRVMHIAK